MTSSNPPKVNIHHAVLFFAQQAGLELDFICNYLACDKAFLLDRNQTMNTEQIIKFWKMVNEELPYDRPGLEFAKNIKLSYVGLMGDLFSKLDNLLPIIPLACSVRNIITEMVHFDYVENDNLIRLNIKTQGLWSEIDKESSLSACEYTLGNFYQILNLLTDKIITPYEIGIIPSNNSKISYYFDYFGKNVVLGNEFFITYNKSDLLQEISTKNKRLHQYYFELCNELHYKETDGKSLKSQIENIIFYTRWPNLPNCEEMASYLFISYKQLQRQLKKENINYRSLINEIKARYASQMLLSGKFNASEISVILNYKDVSSFSRAFKKHNGYSISKLKKENNQTKTKKTTFLTPII